MDKQNQTNTIETAMTDWMKTMSDSWETMGKMWMDATKMSTGIGDSRSAQGFNALEIGEFLINNWQTLSGLMSQSSPIAGNLFGSSTSSNTLFKFFQTGINGIIQLQEMVFEKAEKTRQNVNRLDTENNPLHHIKTWMKMVESECKQFLNIPQLGLTRFHQERMNQTIDKYNSLQSVLLEFNYLIFTPFERTFNTMRNSMDESRKDNEMRDAKEVYKTWIKILEDQYMNLFQSNEYNQILSKALVCLAEFTTARDEVLENALSNLPIPKNKDMDDLFLEVYQLKKKVKAMEKQINKLTQFDKVAVAN